MACIFAKGTDWFKGFGTEKSTGHKLFSISGDCDQPGVYEFPWGITVADLLKEVGGEDAKAVQIGGASGRCVPARDFERRLAFEDIPTGGSVIVIGPQRDMLTWPTTSSSSSSRSRAASAPPAAWATPSCSRASSC